MRILLLLFFIFIFSATVKAEILEAGISVNEVPKELFGQWRIQAKIDKSNSYRTFRPQGLDFWNLSRNEDTLTLENPLSGACANVNIETVEGNIIVFTKKLAYDDNKILTDTVHIRLNGNKFSGINTLKLESFSLIDNHLMKTETATYLINGEKISGKSIQEDSLDNTAF